MTGSFAAFNCESLGEPIDLVSPEDNPNTSWDGCLVDKSKIATKGSTTNFFDSTPTERSFRNFLLVVIIIIILGMVYFLVRKLNKSRKN